MTEPPDTLRAAFASDYRLEREIGRGGMATVYLAHDLKHDRSVALKVLRPELTAQLGRDRFPREIQIVAQLSHPHILPLHDSGERDGFLYYVMPYVDGQSLRGRLRAEGTLSVDESIRVLREVADALAYAHERGVIHRDIKPENVMISGRHALVMDFGVAKAVSAAGGQQLTTIGVALGTPSYMSPEQAMGQADIDARSDIYALGILGYEVLTGAPPFVKDTPQAVLSAHVMEPPKPATAIRERIPGALDATAGPAGTQTIHRVSIDGGDPVRVGPTGVAAGAPAWSPDGNRFVFHAFDGEQREAGFDVFVANADGTGLVRLTDGPSFDVSPFWSADGETIFYQAGPGPAGGYALAAVPAAGGESRWLLENADDNVFLGRDPGTGELFFTRLPTTNRYVTVDIGELLDRAGGG